MHEDKDLQKNSDIEDRTLTEEELFLEEVLRAQEEALQEERMRRRGLLPPKKKRQAIPVRVIVYTIAFAMIFSTFTILFETFSIPAIEFIKVSTKLSQQDDIQSYKKAIVTINTEDSKGTGFAISRDGYIVTNAHVIEDSLTMTVTFPDDGLYKGEVVAQYDEVDLAILKVDGKSLPYLTLAEHVTYAEGQHIYFIGNPLKFSGIANEGKLLSSIHMEDMDTKVMMMNAPVYKGNSGSPVLTDEGQVIGVVYATLKQEPYGKVGLFVPIDVLHERFSIPN